MNKVMQKNQSFASIQLLQTKTMSQYQNISTVFGTTVDAHKALMVVIWGPGINISIFLMLYSYRKYPFYIHAIAGYFSVIYTLATALPILLTTGVVADNNTLAIQESGYTLHVHYLVGITCLCLIVVTTLLGMATRLFNVCGASSNSILRIKKLHMIAGYIAAWLCKTNNYIIINGGGMVALLIQDIIFFVLIVVWKYKFPRIESRCTLKVKEEPMLKVVSMRQLDPSQDYCVFANYIYKLQPIRKYHPGGFQVIASVRNKEIDRYIYGMLPSDELPEVPLHSHSFKSLELLGDPIAKLEIAPIFTGFTANEMQVTIQSIKNISVSGQIYEMYLSKKQEGFFSFNKYINVNQLGRYHSITLNDSVTRLYASVIFLVRENRKFMDVFFKEKLEGTNLLRIKGEIAQTNNRIELKEICSVLQSLEYNNGEEDTDVPILFKAYVGGRFTGQLVKNVVGLQEITLRLSELKGEGLQFAYLKPGKVIIVAGGTGIHPFSDFIDLLFKSELSKNKPQYKNQVQQLSPILKDQPFNQFTFELIAAFQSLEDIHPITLRQLLYLSRFSSDKFKMMLKLQEKESADKLKEDKVVLVKDRFEEILELQILKEDVSKIWICGPPRMNEGISRLLRQKYKDAQMYLIL